jgi:putative ATPase
MANTTFQSAHQIGYPECRIILAQCAVYLACSPKSNASYMGIEEALSTVRKYGSLPVPIHLRNAVTGTMKDLGYGEDYKYAHAYEDNFIDQEFLPSALSGKVFYVPGQNVREGEMHQFLRKRWKGKYGY